MERRIHSSSQDPKIKLSAEFNVPDKPKPLCLFFHGWHQTAAVSWKEGYVGKLTEHNFVLNVDMRGRGTGTGTRNA